MRKIEDYLDIINLPHYESRKRKKMSQLTLAVEADVNGHSEEMAEVARLTSDYSSLSNEKIEEINIKLQMIKYHFNSLNFRIIYFEKDLRKKGGKYRIYEGKVKDIDEFYKVLILEDDSVIKIKSIVDIDGNLFNCFQE